jgi:acyl-CoA thioesterase-1
MTLGNNPALKLFLAIAISFCLASCGGGNGGSNITTPSQPVYTVTIDVTDGGTVDTNDGVYPSGTELSITAVANEGYLFTGWSDGDSNHTKNITVTANVNLKATFLRQLALNLRVHIMQSDPWIHWSNNAMSTWVTSDDLTTKVISRVNEIWRQAGISWTIEDVIVEPINQYFDYLTDIDFIVNSSIDDQGEPDRSRLPLLYNLQQPSNHSSPRQLRGNLFHVYIFPFVGNSSLGDAMQEFGWHSVVGAWSNKHNDGNVPEKVFLLESQSEPARGSLSRSIARQLGLVLGLSHSCDNCLMSEVGYQIDEPQKNTARTVAITRMSESGQNIKLLALGDSYTIGQSVCSTCNFPEQLKKSLRSKFLEQDTVSLEIVAKTGWTTTNLKNAIDSQDLANNYDLVTLLIGVNNQYQKKSFNVYETEFAELVDSAIALSEGDINNLIVISIPDYSFTPFGQNGNPDATSREIKQYNDYAQAYCEARGIAFIYITDITQQGLENPDLVASDGLHPSELAYSKFVERIAPVALITLQ